MKVHGELDGFPLGFMVKPFHFMEEMKRYYAHLPSVESCGGDGGHSYGHM